MSNICIIKNITEFCVFDGDDKLIGKAIVKEQE